MPAGDRFIALVSTDLRTDTNPEEILTMLTTAGFVLASLLFQLILWRDDPDLTGIDDLPPLAGILFVLPFILLLVAVGAALRHLRVDPANCD